MIKQVTLNMADMAAGGRKAATMYWGLCTGTASSEGNAPRKT